MIDNISEEQWQELYAFRERVREAALRPGRVNLEVLTPVWTEMYAALNKPAPKIYTAASPPACLDLWEKLSGGGNRQNELYNAFWSATDQGYWAWLEAGLMIGVTATDEQRNQLKWWRQLGENCFCWWAYDDCVIACDKPVTCWNEAKRLHNADGPAIKFEDGYSLYAWNGTRVTERLIMDPESYTASEMQNMTNSEEVRALAEKLGWDRFLQKLGTKTIDTWTDPHTALQYQLLDVNHRWGEDQPRWLKMQSPVLNDGTSPSYIEPVDPRLKTAQAARKYQLIDWPANDPDGLVAACNKNPKLKFSWEA